MGITGQSTDTDSPYSTRLFVSRLKGADPKEGYEPKPHDLFLRFLAAMRSSSAPPQSSKSGGGAAQHVGNPFWSDRAQLDYVVRQSRPQGLPEQSPETDDLQPLDTTHLGQCVGKGRGQSSAKPVVFTIPPARVLVWNALMMERFFMGSEQKEGFQRSRVNSM